MRVTKKAFYCTDAIVRIEERVVDSTPRVVEIRRVEEYPVKSRPSKRKGAKKP